MVRKFAGLLVVIGVVFAAALAYASVDAPSTLGTPHASVAADSHGACGLTPRVGACVGEYGKFCPGKVLVLPPALHMARAGGAARHLSPYAPDPASAWLAIDLRPPEPMS